MNQIQVEKLGAVLKVRFGKPTAGIRHWTLIWPSHSDYDRFLAIAESQR